ncbi:hypothetical protein U1Q18_039087 [Sarracenia purpurea var. burkii]
MVQDLSMEGKTEPVFSSDFDCSFPVGGNAREALDYKSKDGDRLQQAGVLVKPTKHALQVIDERPQPFAEAQIKGIDVEQELSKVGGPNGPKIWANIVDVAQLG